MRISFIAITITTLMSPAFAQDADELSRGRDAAKPLMLGGFTPFATSPSAGTRAWTFGSFNGASDTGRMDANVQVQVLPMLSLAAGLDYDQNDSDMTFSAQVDVLREQNAPIDLQIAGGWDEEGVNDVSQVFGEVAAGRTVGTTYVYGSGRLDVGTGGDEVGMRLAAAALYPLTNNIVAGVDSQLDIDLEPDSAESMHETAWAMQAGPVVGYAQDLVAVTASVGFATSEPRATGDTEVGAYAGAGLGIAF